MPHRSSAWPLAVVWIGLIVYASLHPFSGWISRPGMTLLDLLALPEPRSSRFDLWTNVVGYVPLGLLLALGGLRSGRRAWVSWLMALLLGSGLSLLMELLQNLLPARVPSRVDWYMNSIGVWCGATLVLLLRRLGLLDYWQLVRDAWFVPHGPAGLALLLAWPVALLFPPPLPFALGQVFDRLLGLVEMLTAETPLAAWLPELVAPDARLSSLGELVVITLGLLAPCFIAFEMTQQRGRRLVLLSGALALGLAATTLSTALNFGPDHALAWVTPVVWPALILSTMTGMLLLFVPARVVALCGLVALTVMVVLVNQSGGDPYFASSLQGWAQGRFIRFHGLAQWLGWVWPFVALGFLAASLLRVHDRPAPPGGDVRPPTMSR